MLHAKFQEHRTFGVGEEFFKRFFLDNEFNKQNVEREFPMLHAKFQYHRTSSSGKKDF